MNKLYFGHTMSTSSAYYRMIGFASKMKNSKTYFNEWDPTNNNPRFLEEALIKEETRNDIVKQLEYMGEKVGIDAWIFQLMATPWGLSLMDVIQKHWNKPFITEVDDYFLHVASDNPSSEYYNPNGDNLKIKRQQCEESSMLVVSTEYLKQKLLVLNKNIEVIPNAVDFSLWNRPIRRNQELGKPITIGWEGGAGHQRDLEILEEVLPEIIKKYPEVKIQLLGYAKDNPVFETMKNVEIIHAWETIDKYPEMKAKLNWDIELAPLVDTEFNRCKSNLRWLEASALRIPVVASKVEPYKNTNALLCRSTKEWVDAISTLIENEKTRNEIGREAYRMVRKDYSIIKVSKKYEEVLAKEIKRVNEVLEELKAKGLQCRK